MTPTQRFRRQFLRTALGVSGSVGAAAAPFALNLAALGAAVAPDRARLQGARLHLPLRRQRLVQHGAGDRHDARSREYTAARATRRRIRSRCSPPGTPVNAGATRASPARLGGVLPIAPTFTVATENAAAPSPLHPSWPRCRRLFAQRPPGGARQRRPAGRADSRKRRVHRRTRSRGRRRSFSHNDQQSTWQALGPEGAKIGWGGRIGDMLASAATRNADLHHHLGGRQRGVLGRARRRSSTRSAATARGQIGGITRHAVRLDRRRRRRCARSSRADNAAPVRQGLRRRSSTARSTRAGDRSRPRFAAVDGAAAPTQLHRSPSTGSNASQRPGAAAADRGPR